MSRPTSPARAEVVIVGGGVVGTSAAFHLAEAGVDVLLVERGQLGGGSTSKAAGGVRAQFSDALNVALGARSLAAFAAFAERPGQEIDLHRTGYLFLLTSPEEVDTFTAAAALQNELGVPTKVLDAADAASLAPGLRTDDVLAATFHPGDGYCAPESVVLGYARGARGHGARVLTGVEVVGLEPGPSAGSCSVVTTAGRVDVAAVICTAGAWSAPIGAMAGVHLPVTPLRRQILLTEPLSRRAATALPPSMPMTIDAATTLYLHREGPGVLLGMSWAGEQPGFHTEVDDGWLPDLTDAIARRVPLLLDVGIASRWAGLYEMTPDHNALLGEASTPACGGRFLYATGFSGHGFLQGPAVGEVLRDLYLGRTPFVDVDPLSAGRFAEGSTRPEHAVV
ncbi:MAG TPA: FAD-binding oxidoreductase [Kineosporiaceae bacterium]|nr:FAD-binding oxidoreductase [Kineosporiaceae bacterium]